MTIALDAILAAYGAVAVPARRSDGLDIESAATGSECADLGGCAIGTSPLAGPGSFGLGTEVVPAPLARMELFVEDAVSAGDQARADALIDEVLALPESRFTRRATELRDLLQRGESANLAGFVHAAPAAAVDALDEASVERSGGCSIVTVRFTDQILLRGPPTGSSGSEIRLRVDPADPALTGVRDRLAPPADAGPVDSIAYEGDAPEGPVLLIGLADDARYDVALGQDGQSIVLSLSEPGQAGGCGAAPPPVDAAAPSDPAATALAEMEGFVESAIRDGDYARADALIGEILALPDNQFTPRALELRGLVEERRGLGENARRTFEEYLARFPDSEGRRRVEQRLAAISGPAEEQASAARSAGAVEVVDTGWKTDLRGVVSQFYYRDESRSEIVDARRPDVDKIVDPRLNVDQILSAADVTLSASRGDTRIQLRAAGAITQDFRPVGLVGAVRGGGDTERLSLLYLDIEDSGSGLAARVGRQWLAGSGVFGRFDGGHFQVQASPTIRLSAVAGYPVQTPRDTHIDGDRFFYGFGVDVAWPGERLETGLYFLDQRASGLTDRRAIGITARYRGERINIYGIVDYDVHFDRLSSAYLALNYRVSDRSSLTLSADYLHYPQLTTTSAIIGQPKPDLDIVKQRFDHAFIKQLAKDRSQASRSLSLTWSQSLSPRWQLNADLAVARLSDAPGSGGVLPIEGSGTDFYTGAQLVGTDVLTENSTVVAGLRYADVQKFRIVAADVGARLSVGPKLRVDPRLRVGYRDDKIGRGWQWTVQPSLRATYPITRSLEFDAEAGVTFIDQRIDDPVTEGSREERSWFVNVGYRYTF